VLLLALPIGMALAAGPTVGNRTIQRKAVDTYEDFTVVDTNHPVSKAGTLSLFQYYAANTNPFELMLVDKKNVVRWISATITPSRPGAYNLKLPKPIPVEAGWNIGVHSDSTGVIPFDMGGANIVSTDRDSGTPAVGSALTPFSIPSKTFSRTYSLAAQ
jgi:hypothetical protein